MALAVASCHAGVIGTPLIRTVGIAPAIATPVATPLIAPLGGGWGARTLVAGPAIGAPLGLGGLGWGVGKVW